LDVLKGCDVVFEESIGIGRLTWDPDGKLFSNYPDSVISCKNFGETIGVSGNLYKQLWYDGYEKRLVINSYKGRKEGYWFGCGCAHCEQYGAVINGINNYGNGNYKFVLNLLNSVIDDKCIARHGSTFVKLLNHIKSAAHAKVNISMVRDYIIDRYGVNHEQFYRALAVALRFGDVGIIGSDVAVLKKYSIVAESKGKTRYYKRVGGDYYAVVNDVLVHFDKDHHPCDNGLIYRPVNDADTMDAIVEFFCKSYGDLFICVDGYEANKCSGFATCGFTDEFEYTIASNTNGRIIIAEYSGYYLLY